ncbi:hypothetical protein MLD38_028849 [Melastoma candidum]|uniref:Uncharacterized protein n=1 Tax=Melastoma candidum TaxID=119954 RepID=A0ACB9N328_9MYRT|nr:hypothetical protein MLD38_028849 [Melastoma candidum]
MGEELHKLASATQETIDELLSALWSTRKTGLRPPQLSHFQSLLNLSTSSQLLPLAACLRSLIRRCVYEGCDDADVMRTFSPDLPSHCAKAVASSLRKGVSVWKEELGREESMGMRRELPREVKTSLSPYFSNSLLSGGVSPAGTFQDDPVFGFSSRTRGTSLACAVDSVLLNSSPLSKQHDEDAAADTAPIPYISSITWTLVKQKRKGSNVAVVTLKLQDRSNSPPLEKEVKIQLTTENVEEMYKSLGQIVEEFSTVDETSVQPLEKKQKQ